MTAERTEIRVTHRGKTYTLWRRGDNLYLRYRKRGKGFWKTLGTGLKEHAVKQAKKELDTLERDDWKPKKPVASVTTGTATVGDVLDRLEKNAAAAGISPRSIRDYTRALERFVSIVSKKSDPRQASTDILTEDAVARYIQHLRTTEIAGPDGTMAVRPDASIRSELTQARAVFSKDKMGFYKGLVLPDLAKFKSAAPTPKWAAAPRGFTSFPRESVVAMMEGAEQLRLARDPVWVCWALMHNLGVRNMMVFQAKWSDFRETGGNVVFVTRGNYREAVTQRLAVRPDLWAQLKEFAPAGTPDQDENFTYVVPARHKTERHDICYKRVNRFFEKYIPTPKGRKKSYQLRGQAASIALKFHGVDAAMQMLGHKHPATTLNNYASYLRESAGITPEDHAKFYGLTPPQI